MFRHVLIFVISALLLVETCRADAIDDADAALSDLREEISANLNAGFLEHVDMAKAVETAALDTKEDATDDVAACVDKLAEEAIHLIYENSADFVDEALKFTYDENIEIVKCGRSDDECLAGVSDEIKAMTEGAADMANEKVAADRAAVEEKIDQIKACAEGA